MDMHYALHTVYVTKMLMCIDVVQFEHAVFLNAKHGQLELKVQGIKFYLQVKCIRYRY